MGKTYGFPNALKDFGGNVNDPRYLAAAQAIGATIDNVTGKAYDNKDGHQLSEGESDQRARDAGVAMDSNRQRGGYLNQRYDANSEYIDPALQIGASMIPGAGTVLGPMMAAALAYGHTHDLGSSALAGVKSYGLGALARGAGKAFGKIPGVSGAGDAIGNAARGIENAIPGGSGLADAAGSLYHQFGSAGDQIGNALKPLAVGAQRAGFRLPGLSDIGNFLGGNGGMNALGLAGGLQAAQLGQKSQNYADMAAGNADRAYQQTAPLRVAGIAGMLNPQTPDLSGLAATRMAGNPFAKPMNFAYTDPTTGQPTQGFSGPGGGQGTGDGQSGQDQGLPQNQSASASLTGGPMAAAQLQKMLLNSQGAPPQAQGMVQGGTPARGPLT